MIIRYNNFEGLFLCGSEFAGDYNFLSKKCGYRNYFGDFDVDHIYRRNTAATENMINTLNLD